jgi:hypothetical protein
LVLNTLRSIVDAISVGVTKQEIGLVLLGRNLIVQYLDRTSKGLVMSLNEVIHVFFSIVEEVQHCIFFNQILRLTQTCIPEYKVVTYNVFLDLGVSLVVNRVVMENGLINIEMVNVFLDHNAWVNVVLSEELDEFCLVRSHAK